MIFFHSPHFVSTKIHQILLSPLITVENSNTCISYINVINLQYLTIPQTQKIKPIYHQYVIRNINYIVPHINMKPNVLFCVSNKLHFCQLFCIIHTDWYINILTIFYFKTKVSRFYFTKTTRNCLHAIV